MKIVVAELGVSASESPSRHPSAALALKSLVEHVEFVAAFPGASVDSSSTSDGSNMLKALYQFSAGFQTKALIN